MNYSIQKIKNALQNGDIKDTLQKPIAEAILKMYQEDQAVATKEAKQFLKYNVIESRDINKIENDLTIDYYDKNGLILSIERGSNKISLSSQLFKNNAEFGEYVAILGEILTKLN